MSGRLAAWILILALLFSGGVLLPALPGGAGFVATAQAQSRLRELIDRLRGATMPDGIVKSNGRIEATQVDVSTKYDGRLDEVLVREGDNVTAGQIVARVASPQYEAQLRSAQSQVLVAKQSFASAEALVAQRISDLQLANIDLSPRPAAPVGRRPRQADRRPARGGGNRRRGRAQGGPGAA